MQKMRNTILTAVILFCQQMAIAQNVGIGTTAPTGPLSFGIQKSTEGLARTIAFDNNIFGIGVLGEDLFFSTGDVTYGDFVFGQGNSSVFTPVMRIQADGNVGIGVSKPMHRLDVGNRIRSRWTSTSITPGILHLYAFDVLDPLQTYFTGLFGPYTIGMIGGGKVVLQIDGRYGALGLNNSYGLAGQVAVSNGNTNTATWQTMPEIYSNISYTFEFNNYTLTDAAPTANLTAFTIPKSFAINSKLFIDYALAANTAACAFCPPTYFKVEVSVNGVLINSSVFEVGNGRSTTASDGILVFGGLNPVITVGVTKISGPSLNLPASAGRTSSITIWPVPEK